MTFDKDQVYYLIGIFGVFILPNYSKSKEYIFLQLIDKINRYSSNRQDKFNHTN